LTLKATLDEVAMSCLGKMRDEISSGFREVGEFRKTDDAIEVILRDCKEDTGVYVFASADRPLYVGETKMELGRRLYFYARPGSTQRTNIRVNGLLRDSMKLRGSVRILFFPLKHLESSLIRSIGPPWNETLK